MTAHWASIRKANWRVPDVYADGQEGPGGSRRSPRTNGDCKRTGQTRSVESLTAAPRAGKTYISVDFNHGTRAKTLPCTSG